MKSRPEFFLYLLPESLRPLFKHVSPSAFKVVKWRPLLSSAGKIAGQLLKKSGIEELKQSKRNTMIEPFLFAPVSFDVRQKSENRVVLDRSFGQNLLALYFWQIFCSETWFLDLRAVHFYSKKNHAGKDSIVWRPNGLYHKFQTKFIFALRDLYRGFYLGDFSLLERSAEKLGLVGKDFTNMQRTDLFQLLERHFGRGKSANIIFSLNDFIKSFDELFSFLKDNNIRISSDFVFLGAYLVTLYMSLDTVGEPLSPSDAIKQFL